MIAGRADRGRSSKPHSSFLSSSLNSTLQGKSPAEREHQEPGFFWLCLAGSVTCGIPPTQAEFWFPLLKKRARNSALSVIGMLGNSDDKEQAGGGASLPQQVSLCFSPFPIASLEALRSR